VNPRPPGQRVFYGWWMVAGLGLTELVSWGVLVYAFPVFVVPMRASLGWSPAAITGAYTAGIAVSGLAAVPVGRWLQRHGARGLMTVGSLLGTAALAGWARTSCLACFYGWYALAGLAMAGILYEPAFAVTAAWFSRRRAQAVLVLTGRGRAGQQHVRPAGRGADRWLRLADRAADPRRHPGGDHDTHPRRAPAPLAVGSWLASGRRRVASPPSRHCCRRRRRSRRGRGRAAARVVPVDHAEHGGQHHSEARGHGDPGRLPGGPWVLPVTGHARGRGGGSIPGHRPPGVHRARSTRTRGSACLSGRPAAPTISGCCARRGCCGWTTAGTGYW
jgi:hypothetical protein